MRDRAEPSREGQRFGAHRSCSTWAGAARKGSGGGRALHAATPTGLLPARGAGSLRKPEVCLTLSIPIPGTSGSGRSISGCSCSRKAAPDAENMFASSISALCVRDGALSAMRDQASVSSCDLPTHPFRQALERRERHDALVPTEFRRANWSAGSLPLAAAAFFVARDLVGRTASWAARVWCLPGRASHWPLS